MKAIDRIHTDNPARGVMGTVLDLVAMNFIVGPKRVRRLMRKMRVIALMPRRNLTKGQRQVCQAISAQRAGRDASAAGLVH